MFGISRRILFALVACWAIAALALGCGVFVSDKGGEGEPCLAGAKCKGDLVCNTETGICERPDGDDGGSDPDGGTDGGTEDGADGGCEPDCVGMECGDNGCGGTCGTCTGGKVCQDGQCICESHSSLGCHNGDVWWFDSCGNPEDLATACDNGCTAGECDGCTPDCSGRECGPDPECGTSCGNCGANETCNPSGQCVCDYEECNGSCCAQGDVCAGGSCCAPDCSGRVCGPDPVCGTSCGTCVANEVCNASGQCECEFNDCLGSCCADGDVCTTGGCLDIGLEWIDIEGGSFMMGSDENTYSQPVHEVAIQEFKITKTEVTVSQFAACVDSGACTTPGTGTDCNWQIAGRDEHPINCLDWQQAVEFCSWIDGRLPTEAEWEYAARSEGQDITYPWGDDSATCYYAVMSDGGDGCGQGQTFPVCSKTPGNTEQGLCDMAGNVWEWVQDWYHEDYTAAPSDGSAWEDPEGTMRVVRGGAWIYGVERLKTYFRVPCNPGSRPFDSGFRCVK